LALASIILNAYFFSGIILTDVLSGFPASPISRTRFGLMVTSFSTCPVMVRLSVGFTGSLVFTVTFFLSLLPPYPLVLVFMVTFPSPPGGICLV
jgi:hypothetical protein